MVYSLYNFKLKTSGASILHTPRSLYNDKVKKPGDGLPFNEQMIQTEIVPGTDTFYPAVSGDDGYRYDNSSLDNSDIYLYMGSYFGTACSPFIRFVNVTVPIGATITEAYITYFEDFYSPGLAPAGRIYFNKIGSAVAPTSLGEYNALVLTTAYVDHTFPSSGGANNTPSLISVVQEVIDAGSWASGNAMMAVIHDNASPTDEFVGLADVTNTSGTKKAELHLTWS